jgi:hypothetical protein
MLILLLIRRLSPRARIITGLACLVAGAALAADDDTNRRVRAVLAYLGAG